jgi:hypothetical protein
MASYRKQALRIRAVTLALAMSCSSLWAIKYGPEDAALIAACGIGNTKISGSPVSSGRVLPEWKWNSQNPFYDDLDMSPQRMSGVSFRFPTCESIILDALLTDERGGPQSVARRCQAMAGHIQKAKIDLANGVSLGAGRSVSYGSETESLCRGSNREKNDAEFACAYIDHQKDFRNFQVQLDALNEVDAFCSSAGVRPQPTNSFRGRNMASTLGVNQYGQACVPQGNGLVIMHPQKSTGQAILDILPTMAAIGSLTYSNYLQNKNAKLAIESAHDLGYAVAVNPWSSASAGGGIYGAGAIGLGAGVAGGIGLGGVGGIGFGGGIIGGGSCGVPPYNMGYTGCPSAGIPGWGYGGQPGYGYGMPGYGYGMPGYGYGHGAYPGYGYGSGYGRVPGPYGTLGGSGGWSPYTGVGGRYPTGGMPGPYGTLSGGNGYGGYGYGPGGAYMGGYGGAGAWAQQMAREAQMMQYNATQVAQKEKQLQQLEIDRLKLDHRSGTAYGEFQSLMSNFYGSGSGGYYGGSQGFPYDPYMSSGYTGGYTGNGAYCIVSPCQSFYPPFR